MISSHDEMQAYQVPGFVLLFGGRGRGLEKQQDSITRGHSLKLVNNRYHCDFRKLSFAPRIVNVWNSLPPETVISADTTDTFKRRLDKFWQHQDILYDYKVELTGVGNRSQINAEHCKL